MKTCVSFLFLFGFVAGFSDVDDLANLWEASPPDSSLVVQAPLSDEEQLIPGEVEQGGFLEESFMRPTYNKGLTNPEIDAAKDMKEGAQIIDDFDRIIKSEFMTEDEGAEQDVDNYSATTKTLPEPQPLFVHPSDNKIKAGAPSDGVSEEFEVLDMNLAFKKGDVNAEDRTPLSSKDFEAYDEGKRADLKESQEKQVYLGGQVEVSREDKGADPDVDNYVATTTTTPEPQPQLVHPSDNKIRAGAPRDGVLEEFEVLEMNLAFKKGDVNAVDRTPFSSKDFEAYDEGEGVDLKESQEKLVFLLAKVEGSREGEGADSKKSPEKQDYLNSENDIVYEE